MAGRSGDSTEGSAGQGVCQRGEVIQIIQIKALSSAGGADREQALCAEGKG